MTKYTYSKTINSAKLSEEITRSNIASQFDHIDILTGGASFNAWFKTALSTEDQATLAALVTTHDAAGVQEVKVVQDLLAIDAHTGKLLTKDQPYNGPVYLSFVSFKTGQPETFLNGGDTFWSIDTATPGLTKISLCPTFSYEIDGGGYELIGTKPASDVSIKCILAPDIPAQSGGSYTFINNKRIVKDNDTFQLYTSPKYISYIAQLPIANKLQFQITHDANEHIELEVFARIYKV